SLERRCRQPRVLLGQFAAHADEMHDGEDFRAAVVVLRGGDRIGKEPADIRLSKARWRARRNEAVDLAGREEFGDRLVLWAIFEAHTGWQLDRDLLRAPGMFDAATYPMDVRGFDAEIILEDGARPDDRRELVLRQADFAPLKVLGLLHAVCPRIH